MNEIVKGDIVSVLVKAIEFIDNHEVLKLRELSDKVIHNASIFQDEDSVSVAVIIYTLSKMYKDKIDPPVRRRLVKALALLEKNDEPKYKAEIKELFKDITKTAKEKSSFFHDVLERAEIKKGSKMYYHGISLGRVAETLGLTRWDMMNYIGNTDIPDSYDYETNVKDKMAFVRKMFER